MAERRPVHYFVDMTRKPPEIIPSEPVERLRAARQRLTDYALAWGSVPIPRCDVCGYEFRPFAKTER